MLGPNFSDKSKPELINLSVKSPKILSPDILFGIITDHPETPIQYLRLCAALAVKGGLSREEALRAITINAAKVCKIDEKVGSIKVGKDADLAVFSTDPLDILSEPEMVFIDGNLIYAK